MKIRRACAADCSAISIVLHEAFSPLRARYTDEAYAITVLNEEKVLERMKAGITWLAEEEGLPLGTGTINYTDEGHYITGMAVLPSAQGKKIGRKLLEIIEENARQEGEKRLHLLTTPFLHRAITLYEHNGYKRMENGITELKGQKVIQFEKYLK